MSIKDSSSSIKDPSAEYTHPDAMNRVSTLLPTHPDAMNRVSTLLPTLTCPQSPTLLKNRKAE
ncbi:MAG: hypothetical protein C6Y22_12910 [Hapalosiphonaceae cyanobacterium JJU2]|nr:MAG: hypothetical protein C6Y22_12910 [Hapalosiphonaceae cyanobacterium JJU2]